MAKKPLLVIFLVTILIACGSVKHQVILDEKFTTSPEMRIEVGKVSNVCGGSFDINIEEMLTSAFTTELKKKAMLWSGESGPKFTLETKIIEYQEGEALKRGLWFLPGWGSWVFTTQSDLREEDKIVGSVEARRYLYAGGESKGAWETVLASIAKDVVADFEAQIKKKNN
jgi:hypothetical protein